MRGLERRIAAGLDPRVNSVASLFVSRWDKAVADKVPPELRNRLGIADRRAHLRAHCDLAQHRSAGAISRPPARASSACCGRAPAPRIRRPRPTLYVEALAAPETIDTMPEKTLLAFARAARSAALVDGQDGGDAEQVLARFAGGRHRRGRACAASLQTGRRGVLRQVLERTHAEHRRQERGARHFVSPEHQSAWPGPARAGGAAGRCAAADHRLLQRAARSGVAAQRVAFGTSGHRGSSFELSFNEAHVLAITQAICDYRKQHGIDGPLFIGFDTHALSAPAFATALEVLAANGVEVMTAAGDEYTPTPAISHAILDLQPRPHSRSRRRHRHHAVAQSARQRRLQIQPAERRTRGYRRDRAGWKRVPTICCKRGSNGVAESTYAQARRAATTHRTTIWQPMSPISAT